MQILEFDNEAYGAAEASLCQQHAVNQDDVLIESELKFIQISFGNQHPELRVDRDYEFPYWHNNLRMFWAYLYHDDFYAPDFIPGMRAILQSMDRPWFAQFECYSPALESSDSPSGHVGQFLIHEATVMFCTIDKNWPAYRLRLGV